MAKIERELTFNINILWQWLDFVVQRFLIIDFYLGWIYQLKAQSKSDEQIHERACNHHGKQYTTYDEAIHVCDLDTLKEEENNFASIFSSLLWSRTNSPVGFLYLWLLIIHNTHGSTLEPCAFREIKMATNYAKWLLGQQN